MNSSDPERRITDYRDLHVWNEAMLLAEEVYRTTRDFPREELFGIVAQMRRAAVSVPANIAEGFGREQTRSFIHFLRVAQGSLKELETQVLLSERVRLVPPERAKVLTDHCTTVGKLLRGLIRSLASKAAEA